YVIYSRYEDMKKIPFDFNENSSPDQQNLAIQHVPSFIRSLISRDPLDQIQDRFIKRLNEETLKALKEFLNVNGIKPTSNILPKSKEQQVPLHSDHFQSLSQQLPPQLFTLFITSSLLPIIFDILLSYHRINLCSCVHSSEFDFGFQGNQLYSFKVHLET
ncbi:MAG: hypothetical protein EZS28_045762, partial [Streblomastix strix]